MFLEKLGTFADEMKKNGIKETAYTASTGCALLSVVLNLADDDKIDMLLAIRGLSKKNKKEILRIFAFQLEYPYKTQWLEPVDYASIVDLIMPMSKSGSRDQKTIDNFEPFNLFSFLLDRHLPIHPVGGEQVRKNIDKMKEVIKANVVDADKPYFYKFITHARDGKHVTAQNLAKTLAHGSYAAYRFCADHNVSTAWTANPNLAKDLDTAMREINGN